MNHRWPIIALALVILATFILAGAKVIGIAAYPWLVAFSPSILAVALSVMWLIFSDFDDKPDL